MPPPPQSEQEPTAARSFFHRWIVTTFAVLVAGWWCDGIHIQGWKGLLIAPLILGVLNAVVRPVLLLLSLPLLIITLGLFLWVINAGLLYLTSLVLKESFRVEGFGPAMWGALTISIVSIIANTLAGAGSSRVVLQRFKRPPARRGPPDDGPVIDV